jgi:hypothetical protein
VNIVALDKLCLRDLAIAFSSADAPPSEAVPVLRHAPLSITTAPHGSPPSATDFRAAVVAISIKISSVGSTLSTVVMGTPASAVPHSIVTIAAAISLSFFIVSILFCVNCLQI